MYLVKRHRTVTVGSVS